MNRAERRRQAREGRQHRRAWLRKVEASELPEDAKRLARELARLADDDGTVTLDHDLAADLDQGRAS